mmetsp:Transcript_22416/g.64452  ORF Transcript_22416/g.64452 Transcript_22416/m.64452 type:complete len:202 (+) Transcript_22416:336-941(+)
MEVLGHLLQHVPQETHSSLLLLRDGVRRHIEALRECCRSHWRVCQWLCAEEGARGRPHADRRGRTHRLRACRRGRPARAQPSLRRKRVRADRQAQVVARHRAVGGVLRGPAMVAFAEPLRLHRGRPQRHGDLSDLEAMGGGVLRGMGQAPAACLGARAAHRVRGGGRAGDHRLIAAAPFESSAAASAAGVAAHALVSVGAS